MPEIHAFRLGDFDCLCLSDGGLGYPTQTIFGNVPKKEIEAKLREHGLPTDQVTTPFTCLFLTDGKHRILVDTGAGDALGPTAGRHSGSMGAAGLAEADVTHVIVTHAHPDHVGGNLDAEGSVRFPNASFFLFRQEWEFWMSDAASKAPERYVAIARRSLAAIEEQLTFVEDDSEIVPGIRTLAALGHTPGHMAITITSRGEQLIHASDAVLHPWMLENPKWQPVLDIQPEAALEAKQRVFDRAAREEALVFAHHFAPFPPLGRIRKGARGWSWEPAV